MSCYTYHAMHHPRYMHPSPYVHHHLPGWHHLWHGGHCVCPVCCLPFHQCCCTFKPSMFVPQELSAAPGASEQTIIGGSHPVRLTLEYKPEATATSASVKVTVTDSEGTSDWNQTGIAAGYHTKTDFSAVSPGATITLETNECFARLRWCELICC